MKKIVLILVLFNTLLFACKKNDNSSAAPDPLLVSAVNGFVSTGAETFQVTDLVANSPVENVQVTTPFMVVFSKPVKNDWLTNETLIKLMRTENGDPVEGVSLSFEVTSNKEITVTPDSLLTAGMTYQLVINAGYVAEDGGILEEAVLANFTTKPD